MQYTALAVSILSLLPSSVLGDCDCHHNNDAGRWKGNQAPADTIAELCKDGGTCKENGYGARLCAVGDSLSRSSCLLEMTKILHMSDFFQGLTHASGVRTFLQMFSVIAPLTGMAQAAPSAFTVFIHELSHLVLCSLLKQDEVALSPD